MTGVAWLAVAAAVLVVPLGRRAPTDGGMRTGPRAGRPNRALVPGAVAAVGACCLLLLGPLRGAVAAALLCPISWAVARALVRAGAARSRGTTTTDPGVPLVLDLTAAALRAGRPPADALAAAAPAAPSHLAADFARVAGLLRLGATPARAWQVLTADDALAQVATVAIRSAGSGARLAVAFERLATELRDEARARAAARAQRVGVLAMAPLGACFLPSFVVLGVVPVVIGMARTVLAALP